ncbi:krueppel-like factor 16 [Ephemerocybe angulata]|uniref:Krueppel-like factor 16 n=1 Tax=Ephemerocybe angulata TaxID=980116 RepID=A0A8H6I0Y7_9AGAR|nr:krueppel-like factor 16 [Tulosesus angulatus]
MDLHHRGSDQGSPYLRGDIALVPPSPELNPTTNFDSGLDFASNPLGTPPFIDNSGSFHNSPYSGHSELSFVTAENDLSFELFSGDEGGSGLFDNIGSAGLGSSNDFDYDPAEYDPPHSGASLMMYGDNDYMSPPPTFDGMMGSASPDHHQPSHRAGSVPYDYSSPSSNNDDGNDRRSRASSVSSAHQPQQQNPYFHSPRLDVAQSFENMTVRSPNWDNYQDPPPTINAPDGDDMDGGPQLHIVPATPIGLPGTGVAGAPFQNTLETLNQGSNHAAWGSEASSSRQPSPFRFPARGPNDGGSNPGAEFNNSISSNPGQPFLFPQQQRHRSKSDNALEPPSWDNTYVQQQLRQGNNSALELDLDNNNAADDTALETGSSTTSVNANASSSATFNMQSFQFGGGGGNGFLSPDSQQFGMRRVKSENGGGRPLGHRQSRSEDIRGLQQPGLQLPQQQQQQHHQQQHFLPHSNPNSFHHGHSLSLSASQGQQLYLPPTDFMGSQPQNPNLLSTHTLPPIRASSPGLGHIRRASSGSRAGRGIGAESWLQEYGTSASSARASPYPSPNASPRVRYGELELDLEVENKRDIPGGVPSAGFENEGGAERADVVEVAGGWAGCAPGMMGSEAVPPVVSKPNVTTLRTANASHKRRKQGGPVCHIRSHNEEKPFVCHWPGCGKGFARQHDCKRHEQLHTNYRPFTCEGCNRQFARMDALNRHLRSEGGAECAKTQGAGVTSNASTPGAQSPPADGQSPPGGGGGRSGSRQRGEYDNSNGGSPNPDNMSFGGAWGMQGGGTAVGVSL